MPSPDPCLIAAGGAPPMFSLLALMLVGVVLVSLVLLRLRQSLLVAYFLCGLVVANSGLLEAVAGEGAGEAIAPMSEFGVMLLLFVLGMEFSLGELKHLRRYAFAGGATQVAITLAGSALVTWAYFEFSWPQIVVVAVACALSSTAISVKLYHDMGVSSGSGARFALGVAIFQDLFIIVFLVTMPGLFATGEGAIGPMLAVTLGKGAAFVALAVLLARYVIPRLLHAVAQTRSRELFTITVAGLCMGVALLAAIMDLSLVLGAFVAGLAVSECIYKHRIMSDIAPLKDLFLTLFFVSVGLGIDLAVALENWLLILGLAAGLIIGKTALITAIARLMGLGWRAAVLAGIGLGSAGEFSLVLLAKAEAFTQLPGGAGQSLLAAMALSMGLVPIMMRFSQPIGDWLERCAPGRGRRRLSQTALPSSRIRELSNHAIVCGYGPVGQGLVAAMDGSGVSTLVIDLNATTIHRLQEENHPALFADARQQEVWDLANLPKARLVAFTFPSTPGIQAAIQFIRERNPAISVIARTKFASDAPALRDAGVDVVVLDEEQSGRAVVEAAHGIFDLAPRDGGKSILESSG